MQMRKNVLITGASSGLGAGMAREFAARGYDLALCARRIDRLEALRDELIQAHGVRVELAELDVNDHAAVFDAFRRISKQFGHIDRVIVNAGIGLGRRIGTGHFDVNRRTIETNLIAALAQCEAASEIFREQSEGHLVLMSSMSAIRGLPKHLTAYAASKAGLAHLGEGIRAEFLGTRIRVTTLFPGYIRTELNEGAKHLPFAVSEEVGSRALVRAIEKMPTIAYVPGWPWRLFSIAMKVLPLRAVVALN